MIYQGHLNGDLIKEGILTENRSNNEVCLTYQPYLGTVENIESIDIKSQRFEITDNDILLLDGDVDIDFPNGVLKANTAKLDRNNGLVQFKRGGSLFLEDYFFKSKEGSFNKD